MHEYSPLAPRNPAGPGTSLGNPFRTLSIMHGYTLLDRLHFRSPAGGCKVRYDRAGSMTHQSFPNPIDHYILFEGEITSDGKKGKLMDFYVYGYSDNPHSDDNLPAGLTIIKMGKEFDQKMEEMIENSPELKRMFEERALMQINMARLQRGLSPLDRLPQKGSCLLAASTLLATGSGLGWAFTHLIA
jgi:hypothetical protein